MRSFIIINPKDNVGVALVDLKAGERLDIGRGLTLRDNIPAGHKFALAAIPNGQPVRKYGLPIGHAVRDIAAGGWVHVHNVKTNLEGEERYTYHPEPPHQADKPTDKPTFRGYRRPSGRVGVRNEIWVIPTVGCVNRLAERLAAASATVRPEGVDAVVAFPHPHGCSQLGDDHERTKTILGNLACHPNAGAVLLVGLGCENNQMRAFLDGIRFRHDFNPNTDYLIAQEVEDEIEVGMEKLRVLMAAASRMKRLEVPVSDLCVGLKCGGSDGLSGITANPLLGALTDWLVDRGGRAVLTEVPEMFGAERGLLNRAFNAEVFARGVDMINDFKRYFTSHHQTIYENPSPGNKEGGITTLEDKSIGCTQKGGHRPVVDVLPYGGVVEKPGLSLLSGPGNDIVSVSGMAAAGAVLILFTTGRGNPLGSPVPVVKVATNSRLAAMKKHWIDFDASPLAAGTPMEELRGRLADLILAVASGEHTKSEAQGFHDFAIFKDGVTL